MGSLGHFLALEKADHLIHEHLCFGGHSLGLSDGPNPGPLGAGVLGPKGRVWSKQSIGLLSTPLASALPQAPVCLSAEWA